LPTRARAHGKRRIGTGVYPKTEINLGKVHSDFIASLGPGTGASTSFIGVARRESADGTKKIRALLMESYEKHANGALRDICTSLKEKYDLNHIIIVHALGEFSPGEPVVLVAVASARRGASFRALREGVERYKKEPAIFKKEIYTDGSSAWIS
jgi:molybdopterin synthase catalytic subunit